MYKGGILLCCLEDYFPTYKLEKGFVGRKFFESGSSPKDLRSTPLTERAGLLGSWIP